MKINENIRALREDHDLTQQEIADLLLIDRKTYNRAEKGTTKLNIEALIKLADYYQISLDKMVGRKIQQNNTPISSTKLLNAYQQAPDKIKIAINSLLEI